MKILDNDIATDFQQLLGDLVPQSTSSKFMFGETTISQVKVGNHLNDKMKKSGCWFRVPGKWDVK